ncbi:hypothetical protein V8F20_010361 [Naviculisporaceae sp. PSN 640]
MARSRTMWAAVVLQAIAQVTSAAVAQDLISSRFSVHSRSADIAPEPIVMTPIPNYRPGNTKRDRRTALSLKSYETFYWTTSDGTMAEFKFEMPGRHENIVNLEAIDDMVREIQCPSQPAGPAPPHNVPYYYTNGTSTNTTIPSSNTLKLRFAQEADFDDAQDIWKWVNQEEDNHFTLVVGAGACGWNKNRRVLYTVTDLVYNDEAETAILNVQPTTWKQAAHTYDLTIGQISDLHPAKKRQLLLSRSGRPRGIFDDIKDGINGAVDTVKDGVTDAVDTVKDGVTDAIDTVKDGVTDVVDSVTSPEVSPDFNIPFDNDFNAKSLTFATGRLSVTATCKECSSKGNFAVKGRFRAKLLEMKEAFVEVSTEGIEANAILGLTLKGDLTDTLASKVVPIFKFSPAGVAIPGLLTIGPAVTVSLGAEIGAISAGIAMGFGGTMKIPPSTSRWDFLNEGGMSSSGWQPEFEAEPFTADVFIEAKASTFLRAAIGLEISAVETGFAAEMTANIPQLTATLKGISSLSCTACGNFQNGIQGSLTLGTNIGVSLKRKIAGSEKALWSLTFADSSLPELAGFCQGLGPQGDQCTALIGGAR